MRILLTNDDGIASPGLASLQAALDATGSHEVWVVAPDGERSGMSHSITLKGPLRSQRQGERQFAISGSPADCVSLAVLGIMQERPDLVLSGINLGPNLGTDITYSGTAAAARQAAYMDIPGVALSMVAYEAPWHFDHLCRFVVRNLERFVRLFDHDHFLNINCPNTAEAPCGYCVTHPCRRRYNDRMERYVAPRGDEYWFLKGEPISTDIDEGSDWDVVNRGDISVSPIHLHPVNDLVDRHYQTMGFD